MNENGDIPVDLLLSLRKFLVPEIVYGEGASLLAGRHAFNLGATKAFIVTDPGVRKVGWPESVEKSLSSSGLPFVVFDAVTPNPKDHEVMTGAALYRESGCDLIIAVGGGSPMDCAKGIGVMAGNPGHILDYEGVDEIPNPGPPLIFIPTTAGSSADVSQFAIITDTKRKVKIAIVSKMVIPDLALVDPATTVTMPADLTAETGMDALCHAFEAFVSTAASPLTDMAALSAVERVVSHLEGAFLEPDNMIHRNQMMMASLMAGLAFSNASLGLVHAMAHSLGGAFGLAHGECNAILLEEVVRYNYPAAKAKYDRLSNHMACNHTTCNETSCEKRSGDPGSQLIESLVSLRRRVGITQRLKDIGISMDDLPQLAEHALQDPCLATNPRQPHVSDIETIYQRIYN